MSNEPLFTFEDKVCHCLCTRYRNTVYDHKDAIEVRREIAEGLCCKLKSTIDLIKKHDIAKANVGSMDILSKCLVFGPLGCITYTIFGFPSVASFEQIGTITNTNFLTEADNLHGLKNYVNGVMTGPAPQAM